MRKIILSFLILFSSYFQCQEIINIKGKLIFSESFNEIFPNILVRIKDSDNSILLDENGFFNLETSIRKDTYTLIFSHKDFDFKEYKYDYSWAKRIKPKSISLAEKCDFNGALATKDFSNNRMSIFYFDKTNQELSKKDKRFEKKNKINYKKVELKNMKSFDCYLKYNKRVFLTLRLNNKKLNNLKTDVIGYNFRFNN